MKVIYPGSFDPITNGHLDMIERSSKKFKKVIVAVLNNDTKNNLFSIDERMDMIREVTKEYGNVEVDSFSGLLVEYAKKKNSSVVIRGLRAVSDFEYEMQMALTNKSLYKDIEVFFLSASTKYSFLSSSIVREISKLGGDVSELVPNQIEKRLEEKFKGGN